jgi:uncharacterized protein YbgA (DUF1722 family)/uncharacterized protein YbbK (DUF523 family)
MESKDGKKDDKIKLGVSSCLLGQKVRYDGGHKRDLFLTDTLGLYVEWMPLCPEVEYGLPVPREPMKLVGAPSSPRLVTIRTGIDHTEGMLNWANKRLADLKNEGLCGFIFKSKSPSSGMQRVKVYSESGIPSRTGVGIFAGAFIKRFPLIPTEDEGRLNDLGLRENFLERVFVFKRWRELCEKGISAKGLIDFHTMHKLLILSHSPKHYTVLGKLVADLKGEAGGASDIYIRTLMEGLRLTATTKKNTNVLHHIMGYFKKVLSADEKEELLEVIGCYHGGLTPLIVPVTLLNHYVRKYNEPYLQSQYYLRPYPLELMLRNHA